MEGNSSIQNKSEMTKLVDHLEFETGCYRFYDDQAKVTDDHSYLR